MSAAVRERLLHHITSGVGKWAVCVLAGVIFSLPYLWEAAFPATYAALSVLCLLLQTQPFADKPFRVAFCFCLGYRLVLLSWFTALYPFSAYGYSRAAAAGLVVLGCVGIPLLQAAMQAAVLQCVRFFPKNGGKWLSNPHTCGFSTHACGFACLWVVSEWVLELGDLSLPWGSIALSQTGCSPLLQTASLFGARWIAFFAVLLCGLVANAVRVRKRSCFLPPLCFLLACLLAGGVLLALPQKTNGELRVAAVQGNISVDEKWNAAQLAEILQTYRTLTEQAAADGAELILLPESAVPVYYSPGGPLDRVFSDIAERYGCVIVMGILRKEGDSAYNSLATFTPSGDSETYYDKQHLVPFGEMIPFESQLSAVLPSISSIQISEKLQVGNVEQVLDAGDYHVGCMICYDSIYSSISLTRADTDFLVIATNDAWFRESAGIRQHLRYAKLRAVECGRAVLRAGNTGISALLDSKGRILAESAVAEQTVLRGDLPIGGGNTLFARIGDCVLPFCLLFALCMMGVGVRREIRCKGTT